MKTSELTGPALDWAVAKCEGLTPFSDGISWIVEVAGQYRQLPTYSTDWAQGGPIIEREGIALYLYGNSEWNAHIGGKESIGPTPLIAAMRCFVASRLGDEVDVPEEM